MQYLSGRKIGIYDQRFLNFPNSAFETADFWYIGGLSAISRLFHFLKSVVYTAASWRKVGPKFLSNLPSEG